MSIAKLIEPIKKELSKDEAKTNVECAEYYFKEAEAEKDIQNSIDDLDGYDNEDEDDDLGDGNFENIGQYLERFFTRNPTSFRSGSMSYDAIKEDLLELQDLEKAQRVEVLNRVRNEKRAIETRIYAIRLMLNISENYETTKDIFYFLRKNLNIEIENLKESEESEQQLVCKIERFI